MKRSQIKQVVIALSLALSGSLMAAEWQPFTNTGFEKAKASGKTVIVDFHADWCSTCQKQKPILESILRDLKFNGVVGLSADYDKETELKKSLGIKKQSTLVVFKGNQEAGRSLGITDAKQIKELLEKGM